MILFIYIFWSATLVSLISVIYVKFYCPKNHIKIQEFFMKFGLSEIRFSHFLGILTIALLVTTIRSDRITMDKQYEKLDEQTKLLKNQTFVSNYLSLAKLGDRAMWNTPPGGDYDSYLLLKSMEADPINADMLKAIQNQINRVEKKYRPIDILKVYAAQLRAVWKEGADQQKGNVWADIETVTLNNIIHHMKNRDLETENTKAAYFMSGVTPQKVRDSGKTWNDVFETLIWAINNESWCLWGRKMALVSYCELAEIQFPDDVFAFAKAIDDWEKRKSQILEEKNKLLTSGIELTGTSRPFS